MVGQFFILKFVELCGRYPRAAGIVGLLISLACVPVIFICRAKAKEYSLPPLQVSVEEAVGMLSTADEAWVEIVDPVWHCDTAVALDRGNRAVLITSPTSPTWFVAELDAQHRPDCVSSLRGVLSRGHQRRFEILRQSGFVVPDADPSGVAPALCTWCGPENSRYGVWLGVAFFLAGLAMYPLALQVRKEQGAKSPAVPARRAYR